MDVCGVFFMFAVLKINPFQKPPLLKRLFYRPPDPIVARVPLRSGAFFYTVTCFPDKHGNADLSILPDLVGGCAQRLLLQNTEVPILPPLQIFQPMLYPQILFLNTALDFLSALPEPPNARTLGFVDPEAQLENAIVPFVRQAKTVKIYTDFPKRYEEISQRILEEWGLSVIVSPSADVLRDCTVVLAPFFQAQTGECGVLQYGGNRSCYAGDKFALPAEAENRRPQGINPVLFASALYELCNQKDLENLRYARLKPIKSVTIP